MIQPIILFTTAGCHLCDDAQLLLAQHAPAVRITRVDIALDDALLERYGWRIPVLRSVSGCELSWPFAADTLSAWLTSLEPS